MHARSIGPASFLRCCINGRPWYSIRPSPALTLKSQNPSSIVHHGNNGRIPTMRRALHGFHHASSQAFLRIPRVLI